MEASAHGAEVAAALALDAALAQLEETVGDREFVAELMSDFLDALPTQVEALRAAHAAGDLESLHRGAHTLKSNAATFGAEGLAVACRELEHGARAGGGTGTGDQLARVEAESVHAAPRLVAARDERRS
jgi:HPt (histidine-containing phosphotransfer) domain-containing protein